MMICFFEGKRADGNSSRRRCFSNTCSHPVGAEVTRHFQEDLKASSGFSGTSPGPGLLFWGAFPGAVSRSDATLTKETRPLDTTLACVAAKTAGEGAASAHRQVTSRRWLAGNSSWSNPLPRRAPMAPPTRCLHQKDDVLRWRLAFVSHRLGLRQALMRRVRNAAPVRVQSPELSSTAF